MEDDIGEGKVEKDEKLEQKQKKSKKKKKINGVRDNVDNKRKTTKGRESEAGEHLETKGNQDLRLERKEDEAEVFQIPSEDENGSQGMRKWMMDYYRSRPGLQVLQEKMDEFITAHEAQEEQVHPVLYVTGFFSKDLNCQGVYKMGQKKKKDVGLDFYRFQKWEANRNEIMMLQSKFAQDQKRLQELRAQRKFRPY